MKRVLFLCIFNLFVALCSAQILEEHSDKEIWTELGMNMTGLVNQLVPFKQTSNKTGPYSASLKLIQGKNAFRSAIGLHILTEEFGSRNIFNLNIRIGFERRRTVNPKFTFYQTFDLMLMAGNFNSPINDFGGSDQAGAGAGLGLGIEYNIYENLSLSTEGIGFIGIVGGTSSIINATVIPPVSIFLNHKF